MLLFLQKSKLLHINNDEVLIYNLLIMNRKVIFFFPFIVVSLLFSSCKTPQNIRYFQDIQAGSEIVFPNVPMITVQPQDKISIVVNSKDPELTSLFNLPVVAHRIGLEFSNLNSTQQISSYSVDAAGDIDFPILGKVHVSGLNREQIAATIKQKLKAASLIKDPVVTVEFANLCVSVLGEVNRPGRISIDRDRLTIIDAISYAGDLTIQGQREDVLVMREENGKQVAYRVNLCAGEKLLTSPVYYLKQNDVVYVVPNDVRARQSTVNGNNVRTTSFWISLASLLTSVGVLITNIIE